MSRPFDSTLIEIRNNPFLSTKSVSISEGRYLKESIAGEDSPQYIPHSDPVIEIGLLNKLRIKNREIEESKRPEHIMVLAEYGQGKSFSLKQIQDDIYISYKGGIVSYSIGGNYIAIEKDDHYFPNQIMEDIESLFESIDENLYTNKKQVAQKYHLTTSEKTFAQFLQAYDKAFSDLKILVYIFIDELDKVVISGISNEKVRLFLENIKSIGDNCSKSISLFIAGTPNCLVKMNSLSIDYRQRFNRIESNYLTPEETVEYITKKFKLKLAYSGHFPFDTYVQKKVFDITDGNIRRIEGICRELWNFCVKERQRIDKVLFNKFLKKRLFEPIKNLVPMGTNSSVINFISDLFMTGDKIGISAYLKSSNMTTKNAIENFLGIPKCPVKKIGRSFVLSNEFKELIAESLIN